MEDRDRLRMTHRLSNHAQTDKDLELLRKRDKEAADKFGGNPRLFADDILFALTRVATEKEIQENRKSETPPPVTSSQPEPQPQEKKGKKKPSRKSKSTPR